jgi:hypothetical protein
MSEPMFTVGPWRLFNREGIIAIHKGPKPVVAWPGFDSADVGGNDVNVANARLIAAAPDLFTALRHLAEACEVLQVPGISTSEAREALKKAVGP